MDFPKFATAEEVRDFLTKELSLADHTVTFHIAEPGPEFGSGMISAWENLDESEAFAAICEKHEDSATITVESVVTYQIGEGQSENATWHEIETLENVYTTSPEAFDAFIAEYAENLFALRFSEVENPAYEGASDDE